MGRAERAASVKDFAGVLAGIWSLSGNLPGTLQSSKCLESNSTDRYCISGNCNASTVFRPITHDTQCAATYGNDSGEMANLCKRIQDGALAIMKDWQHRKVPSVTALQTLDWLRCALFSGVHPEFRYGPGGRPVSGLPLEAGSKPGREDNVRVGHCAPACRETTAN